MYKQALPYVHADLSSALDNFAGVEEVSDTPEDVANPSEELGSRSHVA